jgi:tRNA pseudouridine38-40 synthase
LASERLSTDDITAGTRIACRVEYLGTSYNGWQSQPHENSITVQDCLEAALSAVADTPVTVSCAGRTDSGVHAHCQIVHFDAPSSRSAKSWVFGANANLPRDIRVHWAVPVPGEFHARFSATFRRYRYVIEDTLIRSAILTGVSTWHRRPLDVTAMNRAAASLLGEQDFSTFRAAACQSSSPMRNVQSVEVRRQGRFVVLDIRANAFLYHMVRNIAGALMMVGDGRKEEGWIGQLLEGRDRTVSADTAAASGLYLVDVGYPAEFRLPPVPYGPDLVSRCNA